MIGNQGTDGTTEPETLFRCSGWAASYEFTNANTSTEWSDNSRYYLSDCATFTSWLTSTGTTFSGSVTSSVSAQNGHWIVYWWDDDSSNSQTYWYSARYMPTDSDEEATDFRYHCQKADDDDDADPITAWAWRNNTSRRLRTVVDNGTIEYEAVTFSDCLEGAITTALTATTVLAGVYMAF